MTGARFIRSVWLVAAVAACGKGGATGSAKAGDARAECERVLAHTKTLFEAEGMKVNEPSDAAERDRKIQECVDKTTPETRACALVAKTASDVIDCQSP